MPRTVCDDGDDGHSHAIAGQAPPSARVLVYRGREDDVHADEVFLQRLGRRNGGADDLVMGQLRVR